VKRKRGAWDGAQPRAHILKVLRAHGVEVAVRFDDDYYLLVDLDGDPEAIHIPDPVLSETVTHLYRRFGELHGFLITDLVKKRTPN
jgi:hypothetical protein